MTRGRAVVRVSALAVALLATVLPGAARADVTIGQTGGSLACHGSFVMADSGHVVPSGGGFPSSLYACGRYASSIVYASDVGASDPGSGRSVYLYGGPQNLYSINESATLKPTLSVSLAKLTATEGQAYNGEVATFTDTAHRSSRAYSVTIRWGDGSSSAGNVTQTRAGHYVVRAANTYAWAGSYTLSITIARTGLVARATSPATVADATVTSTGQGTVLMPLTTQRAFTGTVASFSDQDTEGTAAAFTATIDWGDGSSSPGSVSGSAGSYSVSGSHAYAGDGPYAVSVHILDQGGATTSATSNLLVYEYPAQGAASFLIGDGVQGADVYYWGSRWAAENPLSGGPAPSGFTGFVAGPARSCGATFTARLRARSGAPASVPPYMAVAVVGSLSRTRSQISGTVAKLVVVKTDPGYDANPRHGGTGQVVAVLCG